MSKKFLVGIVEDILINSVNILKDESYQRRVWFRKEGPEVSSYSEIALHFIGNCDFIFKDLENKDYLGHEVWDLLKKLYDLIIQHLDLVEERIDPDLLTEDELLNDPNWHDIQMLAEEVEGKLLEFLKKENL